MAFINCPECNESISEKAKVCVHCGYPLVEEKLVEIPEYALVSQEEPTTTLGTVLKILAGVTGVVGLILAIVMANAGKEFSFAIFLIYAICFGIAAFFTYALGNLVNEIHNTHNMLYTLELIKLDKKSAKTSSAGKTCPHCHASNPAGTMFCKNCGRGMV